MKGVLYLKIKRLEKQLKSILQKDMREYLKTFGYLTEDENTELREWVEAGNSVNDNPYMLYDESGCPMDFINGCRVGDDMRENPSNYTRIEQDVTNEACILERESQSIRYILPGKDGCLR